VSLKQDSLVRRKRTTRRKEEQQEEQEDQEEQEEQEEKGWRGTLTDAWWVGHAQARVVVSDWTGSCWGVGLTLPTSFSFVLLRNLDLSIQTKIDNASKQKQNEYHVKKSHSIQTLATLADALDMPLDLGLSCLSSPIPMLVT